LARADGDAVLDTLLPAYTAVLVPVSGAPRPLIAAGTNASGALPAEGDPMGDAGPDTAAGDAPAHDGGEDR
jgi:hypothetical protein